MKHPRHDFFDRVANEEDILQFAPHEHDKVRRLGERLGDLTGRSVLEPGCGSGPLTVYLAEWVGSNGHIEAFDISEGMVARCRAATANDPRVTTGVGGIEDWPLEPEAWDVILLFRLLPHLDDKAGVLRRLRPALKPGGQLVIAHLEGSRRLNALHAGFSEAVQHDRMPDARALQQLLETAGYRLSEPIEDHEDGFFARAMPA